MKITSESTNTMAQVVKPNLRRCFGKRE